MIDTTKVPDLATWLNHAKESVFVTLTYIITRLLGVLHSTSVAIIY